jgi:hypothetical protein
MSNLVKYTSISEMLPSIPKNEAIIYDAFKHEKKFQDYTTNEDIKKITIALGKWAFYIGLSNKIEKEELVINTQYILENFERLSLTDLHCLISLVAKDEEFIAIEAYGSLSPIYIGKCINKYKKVKSEAIYKVNHGLKKIEIEQKAKEPSREERINTLKQIIENAKKESLVTSYTDFGDSIYNFIKARNLVTIDKEIQELALAYGRSRLKEKKLKSSLSSVIRKANFEKLNDESLIKKGAREYIVNLWLISKSEKEMTAYINTIV